VVEESLTLPKMLKCSPISHGTMHVTCEVPAPSLSLPSYHLVCYGICSVNVNIGGVRIAQSVLVPRLRAG
jgi:hypothetical protein